MVSPRDGEVPKRLAIVQGSVNGGDDHLLSSVILGINEAILAKDKVGDLEMVLVSPISQSFKDQFSSDAEGISGFQIVDGVPKSVERAEEEGTLRVTFPQNGDSKNEDFDMVVILTKPQLTQEVKALAKKFEQDVL